MKKNSKEQARERLRKEHVAVATGKKPAVKKTAEAKRTDAKFDTVLKELQKRYGKDSITRFTASAKERGAIKFFSTGHPTIDDAISGDRDVKGSGKGIPRGRIIEIYGPESSGKSTFMLELIASVQKLGEKAAYIDVEHAFDPIYAERLGVDLDELASSQPSSAEQGLNIAVDLAKSGAVRLIVVDSVAALLPEKEDEKDAGANQMGLQARLMGQTLRKITGYCTRNNVTLIFVNQIRHKIGVFFGNPETTPGGNALKFYASVRLEIRGRKLKKGSKVVGVRSKVRVVKNKVAVPFREWLMDIEQGRGITHVYAGEMTFGKDEDD